MAPEERDGAGGLPAGAPRSPLCRSIIGGRACSIGAGSPVGRPRAPACAGVVRSAVGAAVDTSCGDHGRLTRTVAVTMTTTTPIAGLAIDRESRRGGAGCGAEAVRVR